MIYDDTEEMSLNIKAQFVKELRSRVKELNQSIIVSVISDGTEIETFEQIKSFASTLDSRASDTTNSNHRMTMQSVIEETVIQINNINAILWVTSDNNRSKKRHFDLVLEDGLNDILLRKVWVISENGACKVSGVGSEQDGKFKRECVNISNIGTAFDSLPKKL